MRVTLVDNDGTVIETVQLMQVEGKDRVQVIRAFEAFAQEYAELDENDEMKFVVSGRLTFEEACAISAQSGECIICGRD